MLSDEELSSYFRHETRNHYTVLSGWIELALEEVNRGDGENSSIGGMDGYEGFEDFQQLYRRIDRVSEETGQIDPVLMKELEGYRGLLPGRIGDRADSLVYTVDAVYGLQEALQGKDPGTVALEDVLYPLEVAGDVEYNGHRNSLVKGDTGLGLVSSTKVKDWRTHAHDVEDPELGVKVDELDEFYEVLIGDNGPGVSEESLEQTGTGTEIIDTVTSVYGGEFRLLDENPEDFDYPGSAFSWLIPRA